MKMFYILHIGMIEPLCWVAGGVLLLLLPFLLPLKGRRKAEAGVPERSVDERDVMFSRYHLKEGSERYRSYYERKPEYLEGDTAFREKPGLLSEKASQYHPFAFAASRANFEVVESLVPLVRQSAHKQKKAVEAEEVTAFIKGWIKQAGAHSVGVCALKEHHLYTHHGREYAYGESVVNEHPYAIALTVEMDHRLTGNAPRAAVIMESSQQYLSSGSLAVQLAAFIRELGYEALAHIDANYEVICPLVAREAGLGEIGRMGLLMTPDLGPRVRIAVVTTNLPLLTDTYTPDYSVLDFCERCKKCAVVCPSQSIPHDARKLNNGALRWQINSESCFAYWCQTGTDCGRCMAVCPYAHKNNLMHNIVRRWIRYNYLFRRLAIGLDDVVYGRNPKRKDPPEWVSGDWGPGTRKGKRKKEKGKRKN